MTRKFYEEPQILVMEMDEEEICSVSDPVSESHSNTVTLEVTNCSSGSGTGSFNKGESAAKSFGFGGDDSEEIW